MGMPRPYVTHDQLDDMLGYHPATDVTGPVHAAVRQAVAAVGHRIIELVPEGPAKTTAINKLREAMMWANAAVACQADPIWQREVAALRGDDPMYPRLVLERPELEQQVKDLTHLLDVEAEAKAARPSAEEAASAIFEALGTASVCWLRTDEDGIVQEMGPPAMGSLVFDSGTAAAVGRALASRLHIELPANYRSDSTDMPAALVETGPKAYPWAPHESGQADQVQRDLGFEGTEGAMPVPAAVDEFLERPETGTRRQRPPADEEATREHMRNWADGQETHVGEETE